MKTNNKALTEAYIQAVGNKQFDQLEGMLQSGIEFRTSNVGVLSGRSKVIGALRRLGVILLRNDIKKVIVAGDDVCVIYDFVTDTPAGAVPSVEWLTFKDGLIYKDWLLFEYRHWPEVLKVLEERLAAAA